MNCPNCYKKLNQITKKQYFCKNCYHEVEVDKKDTYLFRIDENGKRIVVDKNNTKDFSTLVF